MSVPTLTNMAMAPAMPPPAAFDAAFFKVCESGTFSSAACEQTRRARSSSARKKVARWLCCTRRRAHENPLPGWAVHRAEARKVHDDHSVAKNVRCRERVERGGRFDATSDSLARKSDRQLSNKFDWNCICADENPQILDPSFEDLPQQRVALVSSTPPHQLTSSAYLTLPALQKRGSHWPRRPRRSHSIKYVGFVMVV